MLAAAAEPAASDKVMVLHDCHPPCPVMLRFTLCAGTTVHADHCMTGKSEGCGECANAQNERQRSLQRVIHRQSHPAAMSKKEFVLSTVAGNKVG